MDKTVWIIAANFVLFICVCAAIGASEKRRRKARKPFAEDVLLLRTPGQELLRKITDYDESEIYWFFGLSMGPLLVSLAFFLVFVRFSSEPVAYSLAAISYAVGIVLAGRHYYLRAVERSNNYLGFFGERYVAEVLDPLKASGWFVFHDVPCLGGGGSFNLDHVAIGPGGVWVVETKSYRKRKGKEEKKDYELEYDGERVMWPWGEDWESVTQAAGGAKWLREWLKKQTGKEYPIAAVLAAPGYYVNERKRGAVRMVNPAGLPAVLQSRKDMTLSPAQIDLIKRQLETKCRDVAY